MHLAVGHDDAVGVPGPRAVAVAVVAFDVQAQFVSRARPLSLDVGGWCDDGDPLDAASLDEFPGGVHGPEGLARARYRDEQVILLQLAEIIRLYRQLPPERLPFGHPGSLSEIA